MPKRITFERFLISLVNKDIRLLNVSDGGIQVEGTVKQVMISRNAFNYLRIKNATSDNYIIGLNERNFQIKLLS